MNVFVHQLLTHSLNFFCLHPKIFPCSPKRVSMLNVFTFDALSVCLFICLFCLPFLIFLLLCSYGQFVLVFSRNMANSREKGCRQRLLFIKEQQRGRIKRMIKNRQEKNKYEEKRTVILFLLAVNWLKQRQTAEYQERERSVSKKRHLNSIIWPSIYIFCLFVISPLDVM